MTLTSIDEEFLIGKNNDLPMVGKWYDFNGYGAVRILAYQHNTDAWYIISQHGRYGGCCVGTRSQYSRLPQSGTGLFSSGKEKPQ